MNNPIQGIVVEMDISHMRAAVCIGDENVVDVKVGDIYDMGDAITIYDTDNIRLPWYMQGDEYITENPISLPEMCITQ